MRHYASQFHILPWVNACLACVLNVKELVGTFNQEKTAAGAFSCDCKTSCNLREPLFEALVTTYPVQGA